jgi:hypothetical protein
MLDCSHIRPDERFIKVQKIETDDIAYAMKVNDLRGFYIDFGYNKLFGTFQDWFLVYSDGSLDIVGKEEFKRDFIVVENE